jgi:hypothetical protein
MYILNLTTLRLKEIFEKQRQSGEKVSKWCFVSPVSINSLSGTLGAN